MSDSDRPAPPFVGRPPARPRVADHVFDSLARAILSGQLEDLSLLRVRQGSSTIALDPNDSPDIRLVQLRLGLAEPGIALSIATWEAAPR